MVKSKTTNYQLLKETDHAETVQVIYDEKAVSLREILLYYFRVIDPLSVNQQGNDRGRQYRTGIYYQDEADLPAIYTVVQEQERMLGRKDCSRGGETSPLHISRRLPSRLSQEKSFRLLSYRCDRCWEAIDWRSKLWKPSQEVLKESLSEEAYRVTQEAATEAPFTNAYDQTFEEGIYVDSHDRWATLFCQG